MFSWTWKVHAASLHLLFCTCITTSNGLTAHHAGQAVDVEIENSGLVRKEKSHLKPAEPHKQEGEAEATLDWKGNTQTFSHQANRTKAAKAEAALAQKWDVTSTDYSWRVDCKFSPWSSWSLCTTTCGIGSQHKTRYILQTEQNGGRPCDDPLLNRMEQTCAETPCPIHCEWGPWSAFSPCTSSCNGGRQERTRERLHTSEHGGSQCKGSYNHDQNCNQYACPIDCAVTEWSEWSNCTEACDGGTRYRKKIITSRNLHGGAECPPTDDEEECNLDVCPIQNDAKTSATLSAAALMLILVEILQQ